MWPAFSGLSVNGLNIFPVRLKSSVQRGLEYYVNAYVPTYVCERVFSKQLSTKCLYILDELQLFQLLQKIVKA